MNDPKPLNEDVLLDRLVDGELLPTERRQLLEAFDRRPGEWRRCALAFLEAQSWREEIGHVAHALPSENNDLMSPAVSVSPRRSSRLSKVATWLALAASLILAFGLGWIGHESETSIAGGSRVGTSPQIASVNPSSNPESHNGTRSDDALTFFVKDAGGRKQPVRVPLVDADTLDKQLGIQFQTGMPDDVRNQLKDRGYAVKSKRQYAPLWLENGRPLILPVEDTNIIPVSNKVF
jgi:anti-sigma factor RsiW